MKYESFSYDKIESSDTKTQDYLLQRKLFASLSGVYRRVYVLFLIALAMSFAGYFVQMKLNLSIWFSIIGLGIGFVMASICITTSESRSVAIPIVFCLIFGFSLGLFAFQIIFSFLGFLMYIIISMILVFFITLVVRTIFFNSTITFMHVIGIMILSLGLFIGAAFLMKNENIGNISSFFNAFPFNYIVLLFVSIYGAMKLDDQFFCCEVALERKCPIESSWRLALGILCAMFYIYLETIAKILTILGKLFARGFRARF